MDTEDEDHKVALRLISKILLRMIYNVDEDMLPLHFSYLSK